MTVSQSEFRAALLDANQPVPTGLTDGQSQPAGRRYAVYRNNVAVSLTEALHTGFPIVTKLLGPTNMDGLAGLYLRAHPPTSPLMMQYGAEFPAFLAGLPQLSHLGYLPDVARLELALRSSYHAADADPVNPQVFAQTPPDQLMSAVLTLAPALRLIRSDWPVYDLWRFNTEGGAKPQAAAQDIVVLRPDFDPLPHLLPPGGGAFLDALAAGHPFGTALDRAGPDFDLSTMLGLLLSGGAVTSLTVKD